VRWLLLLGLSGCAFGLTGPEHARPHTYPACDNDKTRVVADGVIATGLGVGALASAGAHDTAAAAITALLGAVFVTSAISGSSTVDACRKAQEQFIATSAPPVGASEPPEPAEARRAAAPAVAPAPAPPPIAAPVARAPARSAEPPATKPAQDPWSAFWKVVP
jgi:hypothetical protein